MILLEKTDVYGWEAAIRGMRNPMNSWDKSDSDFSCRDCIDCYYKDDSHRTEHDGVVEAWCDHKALRIGPNDHELMMKLAKGGSVHAKYRRMITVTVDITAPLYWWKEFDTYKVGTVANSCSTMHKIHAKEFTLDDFSHDKLDDYTASIHGFTSYEVLCIILQTLNTYREKFLETGDKNHWWQMIQLLPSSYNQKRTVQLNYEVLVGMYRDRKNHKLDEWHVFCDWITTLPYSELITEGDGNA